MKKVEFYKTVNFTKSTNKPKLSNPHKQGALDTLVLKKGGFEADSDNKEEEQS